MGGHSEEERDAAPRGPAPGDVGGQDGGGPAASEVPDGERPVRLRRQRAVGGRPHSIRVTFSEQEYAAIHAAAMGKGISDASWLGEAGLAASTVSSVPRHWGQAMQTMMVLHGELSEHRRVLRNIGGNINQIARAVNSTGRLPGPPGDPGREPGGELDGELGGQTGRVLAMIARLVERIEETVTVLDEKTALGRRARLREIRRGVVGERGLL